MKDLHITKDNSNNDKKYDNKKAKKEADESGRQPLIHYHEVARGD
jgi:hypothetical protein